MRYKEAANFLAFFNLSIFLLIPGILYLFNSNQWNYDFWLVLFFISFGLINFIALSIFYFLINKFSKKLSIIFIYSIFSLGLIILLNDLISPLQLGLLDGSAMFSDEPLLYTCIELLIILTVVFLVWFSIKKRTIWLDLIIRSVYFISLGLIISIFVVNNLSNFNNFEKISKNNSKIVKVLPNVYHFHIDGMQTDYFLRYIKNNPQIKDIFSGFTLFEKNIANYPSTMLSLTSYLTSTTHLEGRFDKWLESYDKGLIKKLKNSGYRLIHSSNAPYRSKYFDEIIAVPELLRRYNGVKHLSIVEFTRIWFARISPNFLTNESLPIGKSLGKKLFYIINTKHDADIALTIEDGTSALSGILLFKDIIDDISYYSKSNQYIFMLNSILHDGYVSSPQCTIEETSFPVSKRYYRQLECTMNLLQEFISELKRMNQYENSLIIIHGDHGSHFAGQLLNANGSTFETNFDDNQSPYDEKIASYPLKSIEAKARALLMIKPISSIGELKISDKETQLLDIYPTIVGQLKMTTPDNIKGLDIYKNNFKNRSRYFYYLAGNRFDTQVSDFYKMSPEYDVKSGILSLRANEKGKTTFESFFKNAEKIKKYKDIKFYYSNIDGNIVTDVDWVFLDGIDLFRHWGAWTNSKIVSIGFIPEKKASGDYKKMILKISDINFNKNNQINSKFYLNNKLVGGLQFDLPKNQYSFPKIVEFTLPENIIIKDKPNIFQIHIESTNSDMNFTIDGNIETLYLGLVELSLR